jgi:hypothetical protein
MVAGNPKRLSTRSTKPFSCQPASSRLRDQDVVGIEVGDRILKGHHRIVAANHALSSLVSVLKLAQYEPKAGVGHFARLVDLPGQPLKPPRQSRHHHEEFIRLVDQRADPHWDHPEFRRRMTRGNQELPGLDVLLRHRPLSIPRRGVNLRASASVCGAADRVRLGRDVYPGPAPLDLRRGRPRRKISCIA